MAKTYENLEAWIKAVELAVNVYEITRDFPKSRAIGGDKLHTACCILQTDYNLNFGDKAWLSS